VPQDQDGRAIARQRIVRRGRLRKFAPTRRRDKPGHDQDRKIAGYPNAAGVGMYFSMRGVAPFFRISSSQMR
jgi:hypothetical protein